MIIVKSGPRKSPNIRYLAAFVQYNVVKGILLNGGVESSRSFTIYASCHFDELVWECRRSEEKSYTPCYKSHIQRFCIVYKISPRSSSK